MGIDPITLALAANKTKADLAKNGQIGYDTVTTVELIPKAEYEFNSGVITYPVSQLISTGTEVVTIIDGIEYKGTASVPIVTEVGTIVYAGNGSMFGYADTGEPYLTVVGTQEGEQLAIVVFYADADNEKPTQHTVSVVANTTETQPIALKYIPCAVFRFEDFGLPFVLGEEFQKTDVTEEVWLKMADILTQPNAVVEIRERVEGMSEGIFKSAVAWSSYYSGMEGSVVNALAVKPGSIHLDTLYLELYSLEGRHTIEVTERSVT